MIAAAADLIQFDTSAQPTTSPVTPHAGPSTDGPSAPPIVMLPEQWSVDDVCRFLADIGLSQYSETFRVNAIDGVELLALNDDTLKNALKVGENSPPHVCADVVFFVRLTCCFVFLSSKTTSVTDELLINNELCLPCLAEALGHRNKILRSLEEVERNPLKQRLVRSSSVKG